jgi:hypothetical protein
MTMKPVTILLAGAALAASVATAQAQHQLPPVSIEHLRGFAAAGMAPMNADIKVLNKCPAMRGHLPSDMAPAEIAQARALGIPPGALWLRLRDAEIEKCLAGLSPEERAID